MMNGYDFVIKKLNEFKNGTAHAFKEVTIVRSKKL